MRFGRKLCMLATAMCLGAGGMASQAQAAGKTITIWWNQGFYPAEDNALKAMVAEWEKQSGDKVNLSIYSGADLITKAISALTTGDVPDIIYADNNDFLIIPQQAWKDKLVDVSDIIEPLKKDYTETALRTAYLYDNVTHKRSYFSVPMKAQALHNWYWKPLVEEAGMKPGDLPKTWDAYWAAFGKMQTTLRHKGKRIYGLGYSMSTKETDSIYNFNQFLLAHGGEIVTPDGKLHLDAKVHKAAVAAITDFTKPYKEHLVPPGAINWGDPDNNSAFYAKQIICTPNASLSLYSAVANKPDVWHDIGISPMPLGPDGKPVTSLVAVKAAFIPKGAKNVEDAKKFLAFFVKPENLDKYLVAAEGRWLPVMPSIVKNDKYWTNPDNPFITTAVKQIVYGPTSPWFNLFNPAYAEVNAQQVWGKAQANVVLNGMTPEKAVDQAFQQIKEIFSKYQVSEK